jgi:hypothetical protein
MTIAKFSFVFVVAFLNLQYLCWFLRAAYTVKQVDVRVGVSFCVSLKRGCFNHEWTFLYMLVSAFAFETNDLAPTLQLAPFLAIAVD